MSRLLLGTLCGTIFGVIDVLLMIPIPFPVEKDKTLAMVGALVSCAVVGFLIGIARRPLPGWATGMLIGLLVNLPTAIITRSYIPILIVAALGGAIVGLIVDRWGQ